MGRNEHRSIDLIKGKVVVQCNINGFGILPQSSLNLWHTLRSHSSEGQMKYKKWRENPTLFNGYNIGLLKGHMRELIPHALLGAQA